MEELPLEPQFARPAVHRVAGDRKTDGGEMHPDLMRAAGFEPYVEERVPREDLGDLEVRDGVARRIGVERTAEGIATVPSDRRFDPSSP